MDWDSRDSSIFESDLALPIFTPRTSRVASVLERTDPPFNTAHKDDLTVRTWIDQITNSRNSDPKRGLYVILGDRAPEPDRNTQLLLNLPFSQPTFDIIRQGFLVNISILRALNREAAIFRRIHIRNEGETEDLISYNIRSSTSLLGDIALSVTTNLSKNITYAIVYGCTSPVASDFLERLENAALPRSGKSFLHPMLMAGLFAEVERVQHVEVVKASVTDLYQYVIDLRDETLFTLDDGEGDLAKKQQGKDKTNNAEKRSSSSFLMTEPDDESSAKQGVDLWLDVSHYKTAIETWITQLHKMCAHIEELETKYEKRNWTCDAELILEGRRIKERLLDIVADYDELVRKCTWVMDGTSLANDMAWNHLARQDSKVQLQIAKSSKLDSTQMRSIALLTMIFLPGTYVASFFAMPLFKWDADPAKGERTYSHKFWIYWVVTASLTLAVIVVWVLFSCRFRIRRQRNRRPEKRRAGVLGIFGSGGGTREKDEEAEE